MADTANPFAALSDRFVCPYLAKTKQQLLDAVMDDVRCASHAAALVVATAPAASPQLEREESAEEDHGPVETYEEKQMRDQLSLKVMQLEIQEAALQDELQQLQELLDEKLAVAAHEEARVQKSTMKRNNVLADYHASYDFMQKELQGEMAQNRLKWKMEKAQKELEDRESKKYKYKLSAQTLFAFSDDFERGVSSKRKENLAVGEAEISFEQQKTDGLRRWLEELERMQALTIKDFVTKESDARVAIFEEEGMLWFFLMQLQLIVPSAEAVDRWEIERERNNEVTSAHRLFQSQSAKLHAAEVERQHIQRDYQKWKQEEKAMEQQRKKATAERAKLETAQLQEELLLKFRTELDRQQRCRRHVLDLRDRIALVGEKLRVAQEERQAAEAEGNALGATSAAQRVQYLEWDLQDLRQRVESLHQQLRLTDEWWKGKPLEVE